MAKEPNAIDVEVGNKIRLRRRVLGISQEKLGAGLGVTFQQVQKYEKGTNRVSASRLQQISDILSVHPSYFFPDDAGAVRLGATVEDGIAGFVSSREGLDLNTAFVRITSPSLRKKIVGLVTALAERSDSPVEAETELA